MIKRARCHTSIITLLAVAVVSGLAVSPSPALAQSPQLWKSDWNVRCTWLHRVLLETALELATRLAGVPDGGQIAQEIANTNCDDEAAGGEAWFSRTEARAASHWQQGLGFEGPIIEAAPDNEQKYLAWLDVFRFARADTTTNTAFVEANGVYFPSGKIYFSPPYVRQLRAVEAHEQFHGVQNATFGLSNPGVNLWIIEGTARAIDNAWALKPNTPQWMRNYEVRGFNTPLHWWLPPDRTNAYATSHFWLDVGRQLRARDVVGYLPDVLAAVGNETSPAGGLKAVDDALAAAFRDRGIDEGGFYRAYPEFVRYFLSDPNQAEVWFDSTTVQLSMESDGPTQVDSVRWSTLGPIAADAYRVRVRVPPGRMAGLRIQFEQDDANLHLIVGGRRYNRFPDPGDPNGQRNVFATTISGSDREQLFYVRVANVARPVTAVADADYGLRFTLTSNHALAVASGAENERLTGGVLMSYLNVNRDPRAMARNAQRTLIDRFADQAGVSDSTEAGRQSRFEIQEAVNSALGPPDAPTDEVRPEDRPPGSCMATVTIFDDERRSVAKILWAGSEPLLAGRHEILGSYAADLHDAVYSEAKRLGQEVTMVEDPEALARWGDELRNLTLPGLASAAENEGNAAAAGAVRGLAAVLEAFRGQEPREGETPAPDPGQETLGRAYDEGGTGWLEIEPSQGDKIVGRYEFTAVDPGADASVVVEGQFVAVPGPLSTDNLWNGCETLYRPPEDNGIVQLEPAVYPPGFGDDDDDGPIFIPIPLCGLFPWLPWCGDPEEELPCSVRPCVPEWPDPDSIPEPCTRLPCPRPTKPDSIPDPCTVRPCPPESDRDRDPEGPGGRDRPPGDPVQPADPTDEGGPDAGAGERRELRGPDLLLEFLRNGEADLQSSAQGVEGSASTEQVSVSSRSFDVSMDLASDEIAGCGFNQSVRLGLQMLASGSTLGGSIDLDAETGMLRFDLEFDQGTITVRGVAPAMVGLSPDALEGIRGDVSGAALELRLDQGSFSCDDLMDFSFLVTERR